MFYVLSWLSCTHSIEPVFVPTKPHSLAVEVNINFPTVSLFTPANAFYTTGVVGTSGGVNKLESSVSQPKVRPSVVITNPVDVVNFISIWRKFAGHIKPSTVMGKHVQPLPINSKGKISIRAAVSAIANCAVITGLSYPRKNSSVRVVRVNRFKFFYTYHRVMSYVC